MSANSPLHDNLIVDKTFNFAVLIVHFVRKLQESKNFVIANQLLKSGTSIGANVREAQNSESLADLYINLKLQRKRQMKLNIGFYFAKKL
jgi:four helix bundle protein